MSEACPQQAKLVHEHKEHAPPHVQDCAPASCLVSQSAPAFIFKADKPDMPAIVLCLVWLALSVFRHAPKLVGLRMEAPPDGRRIPLIYRFCALLN